MGVVFCFIQKPTRGKSVETVKIQDDPIQIANNNYRIIVADRLREVTLLKNLANKFATKV